MYLVRSREAPVRADALLEDPALVRSVYLTIEADPRLRGISHLSFSSSWDELDTRAEHGSFDVAFVQPPLPADSPQGADTLGRLARLRIRLGPGGLIPFVAGGPGLQDTLKELMRLRFPIVLVQGIDDDPGTILRALARAGTLRSLGRVIQAAERTVEPAAAQLLEGILAAWPPPETVDELSGELYLTTSTLQRRLGEARLPAPGYIMRLGTLAEAIVLHQAGIQSRRALSLLLGIGSRSTLPHRCRDLTGQSLGDVLSQCSPEDLILRMLEDPGQGSEVCSSVG